VPSDTNDLPPLKKAQILLALKTDPLISDFKVRLFASASWNWRTELTAQACSATQLQIER
jgi:hypothetical protein